MPIEKAWSETQRITVVLRSAIRGVTEMPASDIPAPPLRMNSSSRGSSRP
ncbi:hypothetical protein GGC47_003165 [Bosea sp. OAE752]